MRKSIQPILLCVFSGLLALNASSSANANLLVYDGFEAGGSTPTGQQYQTAPASTNGVNNDGLQGQGPGLTGFTSGVNWSPGGGTSGQYATVVYPRAIDTGLGYTAGLEQLETSIGSAEIFRASSSTGTGDKTITRITNISGALPNNGIYVSMLVSFTSGTAGELRLTQGLGDVNERDLLLGINSSGQAFVGDTTIPPNNSAAAGVLSAGATHLLVARFFENNLADLWVNPTDLTSEGGNGTPDLDNVTVSYVGNNANFSLDRIGLSAATSQSSSFVFDEVRVGTTWDDVTPTINIIPEPTSAALLGLAGLALLIRNRRSC